MVATLITNSPEVTKTLLTQIKQFCNLLSESEFIDEDNLNKFLEYFGSKEAISNFKLDFYEISDEEKNDTLFYDIHEKTINQYFIHLTIVSLNQNKQAIVASSYQKYMDLKLIKIITHNRLRKRLLKLLKNVILLRKNDNVLKQKEALSVGNIMWIVQSNTNDLTNCLKAVCQSNEFQSVLRKIESTMNKLYNIFCSSYTIKNSFDTHFIVDNISKINSISIKARNDLSAQLAEVYKNSSTGDESFNPFIEVDQNEEKGYATTEIQDRANSVISEITKELEEVLLNVVSDIDEWLSKKASPELLYLDAKQQALKQKLKWEKMYTSREKLHYLKRILKSYRKKR